MPDRTNPTINIPARQLRRELLRQLRLEEEGRSISGYADYLQKMEVLDSMMEEMSLRDRWGVTKPMESESFLDMTCAKQRLKITPNEIRGTDRFTNGAWKDQILIDICFT